MSRGGRAKKNTRESQRRCVVDGLSYPKSALIRFCADPNGMVVPDIYTKLPGRGFWVRANFESLENFVKKPELAKRALKSNVFFPSDFFNIIESLLIKDVLSLISLARKTGRAIAGFEMTQKALVSQNVSAIIQAMDGSRREKSRLKIYDNNIDVIICLTGEEIGLAFGRKNVIHSALLSGGLTKRIVEKTKRLANIRKVEKEA